MKPLFATTLEFQRPEYPLVRRMEDTPIHDVCPHCKVPVSSYHFECDGIMIISYHCQEHGDVVPMRSAVSNPPAPNKKPPCGGSCARSSGLRSHPMSTNPTNPITRKELIAELTERTGLNHQQAGAVVSQMLLILIEGLYRGRSIELRGFGRFEPVAGAARMGRNPKTGAAHPIPAGRRVRFKSSQSLKDLLGTTP